MLGVSNYKKETDFLFTPAALQTLSLADFYSLGRVHLELSRIRISGSSCSTKPLFENMKELSINIKPSCKWCKRSMQSSWTCSMVEIQSNYKNCTSEYLSFSYQPEIYFAKSTGLPDPEVFGNVSPNNPQIGWCQDFVMAMATLSLLQSVQLVKLILCKMWGLEICAVLWNVAVNNTKMMLTTD